MTKQLKCISKYRVADSIDIGTLKFEIKNDSFFISTNAAQICWDLTVE